MKVFIGCLIAFQALECHLSSNLGSGFSHHNAARWKYSDRCAVIATCQYGFWKNQVLSWGINLVDVASVARGRVSFTCFSAMASPECGSGY